MWTALYYIAGIASQYNIVNTATNWLQSIIAKNCVELLPK